MAKAARVLKYCIYTGWLELQFLELLNSNLAVPKKITRYFASRHLNFEK